jgi:hypothetical protein
MRQPPNLTLIAIVDAQFQEKLFNKYPKIYPILPLRYFNYYKERSNLDAHCLK